MTNEDIDVQMFQMRVAEWVRSTEELQSALNQVVQHSRPNVMEGIAALIALAARGSQGMQLTRDQFTGMCDAVFEKAVAPKEPGSGLS